MRPMVRVLCRFSRGAKRRSKLKRITSLLGRVTRRAIAHLFVFAGGAVCSAGAALVYMPAGVMLAGVSLVVWALLIFDVEPK